MLSTLTTLFLLGAASASPNTSWGVFPRAGNSTGGGGNSSMACPDIHVFGARETTAPAGLGTAGVLVSLVLAAFPGSTSEAIVYPACGGQSTCGSVTYAQSATQGTAAVAKAVNSFNTMCPNTELILVGYSQGGQIMDNAYCGGGDTNEGITSTAIPIQTSAIPMIKAAIFMGNPRHVPNATFNVGTCTASGFAPRAANFICPTAANIQSYCDATDPFCCNGNDQATHQGYGKEYGDVALKFIKGKLGSVGNSAVLDLSEGSGSNVTGSTRGNGSTAHGPAVPFKGGATGNGISGMLLVGGLGLAVMLL